MITFSYVRGFVHPPQDVTVHPQTPCMFLSCSAIYAVPFVQTKPSIHLHSCPTITLFPCRDCHGVTLFDHLLSFNLHVMSLAHFCLLCLERSSTVTWTKKNLLSWFKTVRNSLRTNEIGEFTIELKFNMLVMYFECVVCNKTKSIFVSSRVLLPKTARAFQE